jgi:hypothetical protein
MTTHATSGGWATLACPPPAARAFGATTVGKRKRIMSEHRDLAWWYWLVTAMLLFAQLVGHRGEAIWLAIVLGFVQLLHFVLRGRSLGAFPVQVRAAYVLLLLLGTLEPLRFVHWIQLVGTSAMVSYGYCLLARGL